MVNKLDFIEAGKDLYMLGLVDATGGSLSVREGDSVYVTKKDARLGHLKEDDIVEVNINDKSLNDEFASSDLKIHIAIYKETQFKAVMHAQPAYAIALSMNTENKILPQDIRGTQLLRSVPVLRAKGSSQASRDEDIVKFLPPIYKSGYNVSVIKELGSFAVGQTLLEALTLTTCLENTCKVISINRLISNGERKTTSHHQPDQYRTPQRRSAIPPSIGVMDRATPSRRGFGGRDR